MKTIIALCNCGETIQIDYKKIKEEITDANIIEFKNLCFREEAEKLKEAIDEDSALIIAACSKRRIQPIFKELEQRIPVTYVNIREHCSWIEENKDKATLKAYTMIEAARQSIGYLSHIKGNVKPPAENVLVIGGGIAGIQAALDLAEQNIKVYLVEKTPSIGGAMALLVKTYPTDDCAICIEGPKMAEVIAHPNIETLTYSEVESVEKTENGFKVTILKKPRYVDVSKCTGCGLCAEKCPAKTTDEWSIGLGTRKAIYLPFSQAVPRKYTIDPETCIYFKTGKCRACEKICPAGAPDFEQKEERITINVGAIILATGFQEYKPEDPKYGYGKYKDVITQFQLARILDPLGPTQGKLKRFSTGEMPQKIVMIQCVGSRDERNPYCSRYCCMAALKHSMLIKIEQNPDAEITILYRDIRAAGKGFEEYYNRAIERYRIKFVKGDFKEVTQNGDKLTVSYIGEDEQAHELEADLVVLSCALTPSPDLPKLAEKLGIMLDKDGFVKVVDEKVGAVRTTVPGIYVCGLAEGPKDIPESVAQASAAAAAASSHLKEISYSKNTPIIIEENCGKCGLCQLACPYNAITVTQDSWHVDPSSCQSCGLCITACPTKALKLPQTTPDQIRVQVEVALKNFDKIVFACEECGYTLLDTLGRKDKKYIADMVPITVPCMSAISLLHVLEAVRLGAKKIILLGCLPDRCHYREGAQKVQAKLETLNNLISQLNLADRVEFIGVCASMVESLGGIKV